MLKANNYDLESGEMSVFDSELKKSSEPSVPRPAPTREPAMVKEPPKPRVYNAAGHDTPPVHTRGAAELTVAAHFLALRGIERTKLSPVLYGSSLSLSQS